MKFYILNIIKIHLKNFWGIVILGINGLESIIPPSNTLLNNTMSFTKSLDTAFSRSNMLRRYKRCKCIGYTLCDHSHIWRGSVPVNNHYVSLPCSRHVAPGLTDSLLSIVLCFSSLLTRALLGCCNFPSLLNTHGTDDMKVYIIALK